MRRRWIYPKGGEPFEVGADYVPDLPAGPLIIPDLPGYQSPVTGLWVEGRAARREDLKRTGSRPWEGKEQELKEAARQRHYDEQRMDAKLDEHAHRAFYELPPEKRRILREAAGG